MCRGHPHLGRQRGRILTIKKTDGLFLSLPSHLLSNRQFLLGQPRHPFLNKSNLKLELTRDQLLQSASTVDRLVFKLALARSGRVGNHFKFSNSCIGPDETPRV